MSGHIEPSASIDELLRYEEEPALARRPLSVRGWVVRTLAIAAALTAVIVVGLRLFGIAVSVIAVLAGVLSLLVLRRVTTQVVPPPPTRARVHRVSAIHDALDRWGDHDALHAAVHRWENLLWWTERDPARFTRTVLPAIGELVDERLRQRHGVTRAGDPAQARTLLGDSLWTFLTKPRERAVAPGEWSTVLRELEKL